MKTTLFIIPLWIASIGFAADSSSDIHQHQNDSAAFSAFHKKIRSPLSQERSPAPKRISFAFHIDGFSPAGNEILEYTFVDGLGSIRGVIYVNPATHKAIYGIGDWRDESHIPSETK